METEVDLRQQPSRLTLCIHQLDSSLIEGNESVCAEPASFVGDNAIGEITARVQKSQPGFCCRTVHFDIFAIYQVPDRSRNIF